MLEKAKSKGMAKTFRSIRKIKEYEKEFDKDSFLSEAQEIYIAAHKALVSGEHELLHKFATEKVFPEMMNMVKRYVSVTLDYTQRKV